jgi:hypothetical protein
VGIGEVVGELFDGVLVLTLVFEARERVGDDCWVGRRVADADCVFVCMSELAGSVVAVPVGELDCGI